MPEHRSRILFLTRAAVLIAVAIVVRRVVTPQVPGLNLGGLPLVLAGLLLGPAGGAWVGGVSDVLGFCVAPPPWPYHPFYTLTAALTGALPPLVLRAMRDPQSDSLLRLGVAIGVAQVVTKGVLIPLFNAWLLGWPVGATALRNLVVQAVHVPLYAILALAILRAVRQGTSGWGGQGYPAVARTDPMPRRALAASSFTGADCSAEAAFLGREGTG